MLTVMYVLRDTAFGSGGLMLGTLVLPGILGMNVAMGMVAMSQILTADREDGTLLRAKATPDGMPAYLIGKVVTVGGSLVADLAILLIPGLLIIDGLATGSAGSWLTVTWVLLLGMAATLPIGAVLGSVFTGARAQGLIQLPMLGMIAISGIFYPLTSMPEWAQWIGQATPIYWLGLGMRSALLPDTAVTVEIAESWRQWETAGVLGLWAVLGLALAPSSCAVWPAANRARRSPRAARRRCAGWAEGCAWIGTATVGGCWQHRRYERHPYHPTAPVRRHHGLPPTGPAGTPGDPVASPPRFAVAVRQLGRRAAAVARRTAVAVLRQVARGTGLPLLPVAQLYVRDVPLLRAPGRCDLLQVLWCPFEHPPEYKPTTASYWQTAADVTNLLTAPPQPSEVEYDGYVPEPCVLAPEQITEYPNYLDLSEELQQQLADWSTWRAAGVAVDDSYEIAPQEFYMDELSLAPGWKVGGWPPWGLTDPIPRFCVACGVAMSPLLTIPSNEWGADNKGWIPYEDQALAALDDARVSNPPGVQISGGNNLQLYGCPEFHPHTDLIQ